MASPTAILPLLLLLTISTLSLSQPNTPEQDILSPASASSTLPTWTVTESSIPTSTILSALPSYSDKLASAQVLALITGLHEGAASSLLIEEAALVKKDLKPTVKRYGSSTVTVAKSTRTIMTVRIGNGNGTGASTGVPSKSANGTGMMMSSSSAVMRGGNATVLPPEPIFTSAGPKSEAGREVGMGMGTGMGILVVVGLGVCGVMVLL